MSKLTKHSHNQQRKSSLLPCTTIPPGKRCLMNSEGDFINDDNNNNNNNNDDKEEEVEEEGEV